MAASGAGAAVRCLHMLVPDRARIKRHQLIEGAPPVLPTILAILIVCLGLLLFSRPRSRKNLVPEGGPRIKNALAWLMVKSGEKRRESWQDVRLADSRVPVPDGVDEEMYNDSFVFQGADADGNVFLTRLGFRNGGREVEIWFWEQTGRAI